MATDPATATTTVHNGNTFLNQPLDAMGLSPPDIRGAGRAGM
jgi:hypothetical protein